MGTSETLDGTRVTFTAGRRGLINIDVKEYGFAFLPATLAEILDGVVPGFTASYTPPMPPLPTEWGRVIKTGDDRPGEDREPIVWLNTVGGWRASSDRDIPYSTEELRWWIVANAGGEFEVVL